MSDKTLNRTFAMLLLLTGMTALLSQFTETGSTLLIVGIMLLALSKLFLVAFQFMELKHAHKAWKVALSLLVIAIAGLTLLLL